MAEVEWWLNNVINLIGISMETGPCVFHIVTTISCYYGNRDNVNLFLPQIQLARTSTGRGCNACEIITLGFVNILLCLGELSMFNVV